MAKRTRLIEDAAAKKAPKRPSTGRPGVKNRASKKAERRKTPVKMSVGGPVRAVKGVARRKRQRRAGSTAIDAVFKGLTVALEPPRDNDLTHLNQAFRAKLDAALADLAAQGKPFRFVEGFRTVDRQQWLFGSGRPTAVPYGRAGNIVTKADGVHTLSNHQGTGSVGSGKAADCYPTSNGKVQIPPATDPIWKIYASAVVAQGLKAGLNFSSFQDAPHCELL